MNPAALLSLLMSLVQDAPELTAVIGQDVTDLGAGTLTPEQVTARWTTMQTAWQAAKAKWSQPASAASA